MNKIKFFRMQTSSGRNVFHNFENLMAIFFGVHAKCTVSIRRNNAMNNKDQ